MKNRGDYVGMAPRTLSECEEAEEEATETISGLTDQVVDLQARLSAAEEDRDGWRRQAQFEDRKRADLQARLPVAEKEAELYGTKNDEMMSTWLHPDVADELEAKLKQAEAVVEAVKETLEYGRDDGTTQSIYEEALEAIRRYEEGKK